MSAVLSVILWVHIGVETVGLCTWLEHAQHRSDHCRNPFQSYPSTHCSMGGSIWRRILKSAVGRHIYASFTMYPTLVRFQDII